MGLSKINQYTLPPTDDFDDFMSQLDFCGGVVGSCRRKTVVIDTASSVNIMIGENVTKAAGKDTFADMGFNTGWEKSLFQWRKVIEKCVNIQMLGGNVLFVGHSNISKHKTPEGDDYGKTQPDLFHREGVSSRDLLVNQCNFVFYMKTQMITVKKGKGVMSKTVAATDSIEPDRILYTDERSGFVAKNRYTMDSQYVIKEGEGAYIFDLLHNGGEND